MKKRGTNVKEKRSLQDALRRAQRMSEKDPKTIYYVMDKKYKSACVHTCDWVVKEKILAGWHEACRFKNGQKL